MSVNRVLKHQHKAVVEKSSGINKRKRSRYEIDAVYIAFVYISFCAGIFLQEDTLSMLAIYLALPVVKFTADRLTLKHSGIAIFRGDIIEFVNLMNQEGVRLISSNNVYIFSSSNLSLTSQINCIAEEIDEGIKITAEQFLLEKWQKNYGRIALIKKFDVGIEDKKSSADPKKRRKQMN